MVSTRLDFVQYESGEMAYGVDFAGCLLIAGCDSVIEAVKFAKDYLHTTYSEFPNPDLKISSCDLNIRAISGEKPPTVIIDSRALGKESVLEELLCHSNIN